MKFKKLEFSDLKLIKEYYEKYTNQTCDRTIGGSFMWRDYFHTMYALVQDTLVMKCERDKETVFCFPMGENIEKALEEIEGYCEKEEIVPYFVSLVKTEMEYLKERYPDSVVVENRDWSDYLYLVKDHANFIGRKFTTQRNHINKFLKTYENWSFVQINDEVLDGVKEFYQDYEKRFAKNDVTAKEEQEKTLEVLERFKDYGFIGYALFVENKVVGFSIGEIIGDTMFIHVEKADKSMDGVNAMLVMQFAKVFENEVIYLNREEDVGDMGLRYSKTKYRPIDMVYKYEVHFQKIEILDKPEESKELYEKNFEDTKEFIEYYYENIAINNQILTLKMKEHIVSMLHIVPKQFAHLGKVDYYYAIATEEKYRHRGYMARLLKEALTLSYQKGRGLVYLVPAVKGIYEPFGFGIFGQRFSPLSLRAEKKGYKVSTYTSYSKELVEILQNIFINCIAMEYDDFILRDEMYYQTILCGLFAENGWVDILEKDGKKEGYILESKAGIWETGLASLPKKNYALGRIVNVEKLLFDETKLEKGFYQITDSILRENGGLFYFSNGKFIRATSEAIEGIEITEKDREKTYSFDIAELILYLKYEKVYVSDEI